jgi:transposase
MVSMGKKKPQRARRVFTPEFKAEIVGMCLRGERSIPRACHDFCVSQR